MLFSELYKIIVKKVTLEVLGGELPPSPWIRPWPVVRYEVFLKYETKAIHL